jgi:hypothetical protein
VRACVYLYEPNPALAPWRGPAQCALYLLLAHISGFAFIMLLLGESAARDAIEIVALCLMPATLWVGTMLPVWRYGARSAHRCERVALPSRVGGCRYRALGRALERCMTVWRDTHAPPPMDTKAQPVAHHGQQPRVHMVDVAVVASYPWRRKGHAAAGAGDSPASLAQTTPGGVHAIPATAPIGLGVTPLVGRTISGVSAATAGSRRARDVRASITQLAAVVAATKMQRRWSVSFADAHRAPAAAAAAAARVSDEDDDASAASVAALEDHFATVMAPFEAVDVELLVRLEVAKPENHTVGYGNRRQEHVVLTTEAVERITWFFAMAAREFQASAPDGAGGEAPRCWGFGVFEMV